MSTVVLDASAVLAWVYAESGQEAVAEHLDGALISAVNWSEVLQKIAANGGDADLLGLQIEALGVEVIAFGRDDSLATAALWPTTREAGLSLGDRACLALARRLAAPVLTSDQAWKRLDTDADVRLIR
ncbi:type II toxin-antitoxin system VapC family toxin [Saccharopolyspora sp. HNM0986]|uniref:PIN domain-containing protein n=1 Tax=Saccharopolyspora galaxeae TaxID=2781241 RepID=UPI00190DB0BD|nr:type II toxin-antitoxin system VapC family toxin [Saccharopolyspora sp. HNM0986]MBK0865703.1 type II toxin-antitoxin system VapC family toxin [Saccharopolyspora sp. HNM0986]